MHTTTRAAASLITAAVLALTTAACGDDDPGSEGSKTSPAGSSAAPAQELDRVGSILPGEGWTPVDAEGVGTNLGEYEVNATGEPGAEPPEVTVTWRRARDYEGYVEDRADVSSAEAVEVVGAPGMLYTYSDHDFTVLRSVEGRSFIELRGTYLSRTDFDAFLAGLDAVTEDEFATALEDAGVTPER